MKCSICGGNITMSRHGVYRTDGSSSGTYTCQDCGRSVGWTHKGNLKEEVIDMRQV